MSNDKKTEESNIIQFPRPLSFDADGLPNTPRATVFGLQIYNRAKLVGVMLFLEADSRNKAKEIVEKKAVEASQQRQWTFSKEDYPVY